jgi:hypothetical protein
MRTASDINGIVDFICELCGTDGPGRTRDEIAEEVQLLRVLDYRFEYGQDMEQAEEGNNSELRLLIEHLFDTGWIWGENAR